MKRLTYVEAMACLRKHGTVLVLQHLKRSHEYHIVPGGRVDDDVAERIKQHHDIRANRDGLFGTSQTWRCRTS
jgi:hypothetical protein